MFFLNLTFVEFLSLLGVLGGLVTALYLLDRAKRRRVVSTLRFWAAAGAAEQRQSRRKMNDPWSLVLQLLSLALLLLALSRVQWGNAGRRGHNHVLLLDTSSWAAARMAEGNSSETVLEREKQYLDQYFAMLPRGDRAMLVAADGLATPLTRFINNRRQFDAALSSAAASYSALNIENALSFAHQAVAWSAGTRGEIVYAGPQLISEQTALQPITNLRVLPVAANRENTGIRSLSVQQVLDEPDSWRALVVVKNYGQSAKTVRLDARYGGTAFAPRRLRVASKSESSAEYNFTTKDAGDLTVSVSPGGSLVTDNQATLSVPRIRDLKVAVYTDRPQILSPLLMSDRALQATFYPSAHYDQKIRADVVLLDRFAPADPPAVPTLWLDPPAGHSPLPISGTPSDALVNWSAPLQAKPLRVSSAHTFQTFAGDRAVASIGESAVVVTRSAVGGHAASAVIGFDPAAGELRFEVATPLLFADLLQGLVPDAFHTLTLSAETVGLAEVSLDKAEENASLEVTGNHGFVVPYARRGDRLQIFVDHPASLRIVSPERTRLLSLSLPAVAEKSWNPPAQTAQGLPASSWFSPPPVDIWKGLAVAAGICLIGEWFLFVRIRRVKRPNTVPAAPRKNNPRSAETELAAK